MFVLNPTRVAGLDSGIWLLVLPVYGTATGWPWRARWRIAAPGLGARLPPSSSKTVQTDARNMQGINSVCAAEESNVPFVLSKLANFNRLPLSSTTSYHVLI